MAKTTAVQDHSAVTLSDMKNYLRVDHSADDDLINELISAAKREADEYLSNPFNEVEDEELGRGDDAETEFTADNQPILAHTETVWIWDESSETLTEQGRGADDDYEINYTTGVVTFDTAPETGQAVIMSYKFDPAQVTIPTSVDRWIRQRVARDYERRVEGLQEADDESGSVTYGSRGTGNVGLHDFSLLRPFRIRPGIGV